MAGLIKEVWIDTLIGRNFFETGWFLPHGVDYSKHVENGVINWAFKGSPVNIIKNPVYPLPIVGRIDTPDFTVLEPYATEAVRVFDIELHGLSYDKRMSVLKDTRDAFIRKLSVEAMWKIGPTANAASTPLINTPAANALGTDGYRLITANEIMELRIALNRKYPSRKDAAWVLVLDEHSFWNMVNQDIVLKNQYAINDTKGTNSGAFVNYYGFEIYSSSMLPWYSAALSKLPFGSTPVIGTDLPGAIAYIKNESWYKAVGDAKMFDIIDEPVNQATTISFLTYFAVGVYGDNNIGGQQLIGGIIRTL